MPASPSRAAGETLGRRIALLLSFGLAYRKESPRILQAVEAYPRRWTHHVPLTDQAQLDPELLAWLEEAFAFANAK